MPARGSLSPYLSPLARALRERHLTIAVAESCTGGLVAAALTDLPGSSDYFLGGVVAYANPTKSRLLRVPVALLEAHGAVSREVAEAMARGARDLFQADVAVSVTGIAGPASDGDKPVGLTFVGAVHGDRAVVREHRWTGGRASNRLASVEAALALATDLVS
ncbi:MAG TPA: CinA family protein [Candidatus Dormibacteraeota bacterium]|jgi:PncC family amidohydrolase|nr:CinA family protein [Candidatus Dormibacteraeota bacterium]